ncbi:serine/threonine-protein kinase [Sorangium sp. So ce1036]|uniref:WD40 repeat domain-containing serine/threonine protein kinase n=1 Tax=Sorangium sp. So ce1036 TaxID=3133328 RepID=UPI003F11A30A
MTPTIRLVRPLGQGAMGCVWAADHLALGTQVAVKLISPSQAGDARSQARFRQEAQAAARLKSPHVTQVLDHGITAEGQPFIVMELLEGETLRQRMQRSGPMPVDDVVRLIGQTARALGAAHRLGIVHRDIKPDNLFVIDVEGEPFTKVLDFGIAKQVGAAIQMTSTGETLGTPLYMSPEQLGDIKRVDHRTDLWALGVVAYEALTGTPPFTGITLLALALAVQRGAFQRPTALRPELPAALDAWMARALAIDMEARFGAAMDMAEALCVAAQGAHEGERRPTAPPRAREVEVLADTLPMPPEQAPAHRATAAAEAKAEDGVPGPDLEDALRRLLQRPTRRPAPRKERPARAADRPEPRIVHDPAENTLSLSVPGEMSRAIAFDERGTALIVAFSRGSVLCLDLATRRPRWWCRLLSRALCVTAGAGRIAVGCGDGDIRLLDAARGTVEKTLRGHAAVRCVDMHRKGHTLAACGDDRLVTLWSVTSGECLHVGKEHSDRARSVAFVASSAVLASGARDATVRLWDAALRPMRVLRPDGGAVRSLSFSPERSALAAACDDGAIRLWDTRRWELKQTLTGHTKRVVSVAFGPRGDLMVSGSSDGTVRVWTVDSGKSLRVFGGYAGAIECVAASPDGRHAAAACADGMVRVYSRRSIAEG